jgi:Phosphate-induced protein 1 conserved region
LSDFANGIGHSPNYFVNETYDDNSGNHVSASTRLAGSTDEGYSHGQTITGNDIWPIVTGALSSGRLPVDAHGVYFVLTSADVNLSDGFCTQFCGWHTAGSFNGTDIKFSFVGDASRCNGSCGGLGRTPNGNAGADDMASIIFHELSETVTDPLLNAWGDGNGENGDKCAWRFGSTYASGNGSPANAHVGNRDFLLQQMWANTAGGACVTALPASMGAVPPSGCGVLRAGQGLTVGQTLGSCDGRFQLAMQYDGNLVLYQGTSALWASNSYLSTGYSAVMQNDGNFVLYDVNQRPLFASNTWGRPGSALALQNDGNLVVYDTSGRPLWASNTCCR